MKVEISKPCVVTFSFMALAMLCSCSVRPPEWNDEWVTQDVVAVRAADGQIKIDGVASPGEWDDASEYQLSRAEDWGYDALLPRQRAREDRTPFERGYFKVKYDDRFLYVLGSMEDADVVQGSGENQALSYTTGDMIEIFLRPAGKSAYWELYGTPLNHYTTIFYPWAGYSFVIGQQLEPGIQVAAKVRGTANKDGDIDSGWDIEMAIPREIIEKAGERFEPGKEWEILLCRYNYGRNLPAKQISSAPRLPKTNHHLVDYYAKLKFKP